MESSLKCSSFTHFSGSENGMFVGNSLKPKISWHSSILLMNQSDFILLFWLGKLEIRPVQNSLSKKALTKTAQIGSGAQVKTHAVLQVLVIVGARWMVKLSQEEQ